jgi:2-octaprenyl-6-methoxyphenol hydroxylase
MAASDTLQVELLVVGGGLAGLSLGLACAGAGIEVAVVDREDPARTVGEAFDGRTTAIAYGSQQVLAGIGLWPEVAREAEPILEIRVADGDAPLFLHYDHRDIGDDPLGWIVENRVLRRGLLACIDRQPGLHHLAPAEVVSVERGTAGVTAVLAGGRRIRAALCAAADGKDSPLRRAAGIGTLDWRYQQAGIVCTVRHERPHRGVAVEHFLPSGPFAILPMTEQRSSIVWTERAALAPHFMTLGASEFAAEIAKRFGDYLGAVEPVGPRWCYPVSLMVAESFAAERLALVGEAAHVIHPIAGQGLNLGIRDLAVLAELVVDARRLGLDIGAPDLLARYERWRRVDTMTLAMVTDALNRLFSNDVAPLRLARDLGLAAVNRLPPLKRFLMRHAMGTVGELPRLIRGEPL